jgi:hypothetical protein
MVGHSAPHPESIILNAANRPLPVRKEGRMAFDPRHLPGPQLQELPPERYWDLVHLNKAIRHQQVKRGELTRRLPREVVWQLQAVLERGLAAMHEVLEEHGTLRKESGGVWMGPRITEDSFLAYAWLELACQAISEGEEEPAPLAFLVGLERTRDDVQPSVEGSAS